MWHNNKNISVQRSYKYLENNWVPDKDFIFVTETEVKNGKLKLSNNKANFKAVLGSFTPLLTRILSIPFLSWTFSRKLELGEAMPLSRNQGGVNKESYDQEVNFSKEKL